MTVFLDIIWNNALAFIVVISVIVFIHEMGHFLVARYYGIRVKTFSIGFGAEIFGWTGRESLTRYRISLIPLGGYVAMYGEQNNPDETDEQHSFAARPAYARAAVIVAGPLANFILSFVLITLYVMLQGVTSERINGVKIGTVLAEGAAAQAGLRADDLINSINEADIRTFSQVAHIVASSQGNGLVFNITRGNNANRNITVIPELRTAPVADGDQTNQTADNQTADNQTQSYFIGVTSQTIEWVKVSAGQAVIIGADSLWWITIENLKALGQIVTGSRGTDELGGPIKIAVTTKAFAENGVASLLFFIALLSINLGLINLLPIPMLDGGHLVFIFYEIIFKKPMSLVIKEKLMRLGFAFIMTLIIFVTINDVLSL